ncbi:MAG: hypothetical protein AABX02_02450 [archaeon]
MIVFFFLGCVGGSPPSGPVDCQKVCSQPPTSLEAIKSFVDCNCDTNSLAGGGTSLPVPGLTPPSNPSDALLSCDDNSNFWIQCFKELSGHPLVESVGVGKTNTISPLWVGESFPMGVSIGSLVPDTNSRYCLNTTTYDYVSTDPDFPIKNLVEVRYYFNLNLSESWRVHEGSETDKFGTDPINLIFHDDGKGNPVAQNTEGEIKSGILYTDSMLFILKSGKHKGPLTEDQKDQCQTLLAKYGG